MRPPSLEPDPSNDDPLAAPATAGGDRRLWLGLIGLFTAILLAALAIHRLLPPSAVSPVEPGGNAKLNKGVPLMTRQQLLENQQAMPELLDFDRQTSPPNPLQGAGSMGTPGAPSSLGTGAPGR